MTPKTLNRIRALLALNTCDHRESALKNRNLIENAREAEKINIVAAMELNILSEYQHTVENIGPHLFYEL